MNNTRRTLLQCDSPQPLAAVVIPAHNEETSIPHTLQAVARAAYVACHRAQVIVVANACTDDTAGVAERLGARVVSEEQKGVSYARQRGLLEASAPVILNTDADTEVGAEWIGAHLRHYDEKHNVGVGGASRFRDAHWSLKAYKAGAWITQSIACPIVGPIKGHFPGANSSYRRETALSFGGFKPGLDLGEDSELAEKLREHGNVVSDLSPEIVVTTSGRRFASLALVSKEVLRKVNLLFQGKLYGRHEASETFEDIR